MPVFSLPTRNLPPEAGRNFRIYSPLPLAGFNRPIHGEIQLNKVWRIPPFPKPAGANRKADIPKIFASM